MNKKQPAIVCFGEILWDVFPDRSLLGGAPLNVANRFHSLGGKATVVSSLGEDKAGAEALTQIQRSGLGTECISIHESLPTGSVSVSLEGGIATYEINEPVAWDEISAGTYAVSEVNKADALVFGSLALRSDFNLNTMLELTKHAKHLVFDINLRPPFYKDDLLEKLIYRADTLKLNEEELEYVRKIFSIRASGWEDTLKALSDKSGTQTICCTRGGEGAVLYHGKEVYTHPGYRVNVVDTVGAGDSFLAGLLFGLLSGEGPKYSLELACALGGLVASKRGANCPISQVEIKAIRG